MKVLPQQRSSALVLGTATVGGILLYAGLSGASIPEVFAGQASLKDTDPKGGKAPFDLSAQGDISRGLGDSLSTMLGLKPGTAHFDGKVVAKCAVPILKCARSAGWQGKVTSGYRDPAYSESLCQHMCGAPSCSGTCAGRNSNHSGKSCANFAVDVSDPEGFERAIDSSKCAHITPHIHNDLPADHVHFSPSGH